MSPPRVQLGSATRGLLLALAVFALGVGVALRTLNWFDLNHWREPIQAHLSEALGQEVKLGRLELRMEALAPRIIIEDVALVDAPDRFYVKRVDATLALRALWGKQLKLKRLELDGVTLEVVRWSAQRYRIAGRDIDLAQNGDSQALAWLLDQPGVTVTNSRLVLRDLGEGGQGAVRRQTFDGVTVMLRNRLRTHKFKIESKASMEGPNLVQRFELIADAQSKMGAPKLDWRSWHVELYTKLDGALAEQIKPFLRQWTGIDSPLSAGRVDAQAWLTVEQGQAKNGQIKFSALRPAVHWSVRGTQAQAPVIELQKASAYVAVQFDANTMLDLKIYSAEAVDKKGVQIAVTEDVHELKVSHKGELLAGRFALKAFNAESLLESLQGMPLPRAVLNRVAAWDVRGEVKSLAFQWNAMGALAPTYSAQAHFEKLGFALRPEARAKLPALMHLPAFSAVTGRAQVDERGGSLDLDSRHARLIFPAIFENPIIELDRLKGGARWSLDFDHEKLVGAQMQVGRLEFANADAAGELSATYQSGGQGAGIVDLKGHLNRAHGPSTVRYLPLKIPTPVRDWVARSVVGGESTDVQFRLKGDLAHFPFRKEGSGEFLIQAKVKKADLNYGERWPALKDFDGELKFRNAGFEMTMDRATMLGFGLKNTSARLVDYLDPVLIIEGRGEGGAQNLMQFINGTPIAERIDPFTQSLAVSGPASLMLNLQLPLRNMSEFKTSGNIEFLGNEVMLDLPLPGIREVQGRLDFDEKSFSFETLRGKIFDEEVLVSGATTAPGEMVLRARSQLGAETLGRLIAHPLTSALSGRASYELEVQVKDRIASLALRSDLLGIASALPAPLAKSALKSMPLEIKTNLKDHHLTVSLGKVLALDVAHRPQTLNAKTKGFEWTRAALSLKPAAEPRGDAGLPATGLTVNIEQNVLDLDAWQTFLMMESPLDALASPSVLPALINIKAQQLTVAGRHLNHLELEARSGEQGSSAAMAARNWSIRLSSDEALGLLHWSGAERMQNSKLRARLERLELPKESLNASRPGQEIVWPDLDIEVGAFKWGDLALGRASLAAGLTSSVTEPSVKQWRIQKVTLEQEHASFVASGRARFDGVHELDMTLNVNDCGAYLSQQLHSEVVKGCSGQLSGRLSWDRTNLPTELGSVAGELHWNVVKGEFLKVRQGIAGGIGRLLGVFNLQFLPKRLNLDFSDVFSQGYAFDSIEGSATLNRGVLHTEDFLMKGPSALVKMSGDINLKNETQVLQVMVEPEINAGIASLAYAATVNPVVGLGTLIGQYALRKPLQKLFQFELLVEGSWAEPEVKKVQPVRIAQ